MEVFAAGGGITAPNEPRSAVPAAAGLNPRKRSVAAVDSATAAGLRDRLILVSRLLICVLLYLSWFLFSASLSARAVAVTGRSMGFCPHD